MRICNMMRPVLAALFVWLLLAPQAHAAGCADLWQWLNTACRHVADTYKEGRNDLFLSGYSWHTPWTWTAEKRAEVNEAAWGLGVGRSRDNEHGNTETVVFFVFSDSHNKPQFNLAYSWSAYWGPRDGIQAGLGYTAAVITRTDLANGWPIPVITPLASLRYDRVTLYATYIPNFNGGINHGSVLYFNGKISLE